MKTQDRKLGNLLAFLGVIVLVVTLVNLVDEGLSNRTGIGLLNSLVLFSVGRLFQKNKA